MRALLAVLLIAGCAGPAPGADAPPPPEFTAPADTGPGEGPNLGAVPALIHHATNAARRAEGVLPIEWSDALAAVAAAHSRDMAARGYFSHETPEGGTPTQRATAVGIDCRTELGQGRARIGVLENLYQTSPYRQKQFRTVGGVTTETIDWYTPEEIASDTVEEWLGSPGHRRNLLAPRAREHGIGVASSGEFVYISQVVC